MLIIPAIYIQDGRSTYEVAPAAGADAFYSSDPVRLTKLWRGENAKALHVVDLDGARAGRRVNGTVLRRMVDCVEIALQIGGGLRTMESVEELLEGLGIYRVVLGTLAVENPGMIERLIARYTARKIIVGIDAKQGRVLTRGRMKSESVQPLEVARRMRSIGVERIIYTSIEHETTGLGPPVDELKRIAGETGLSITVNGSVNSYTDLKCLQELQEWKIDSLILGGAFYRNVFPCQSIWRWNEKLMLERGKDDEFPRKHL